jgi:hypothetical protein
MKMFTRLVDGLHKMKVIEYQNPFKELPRMSVPFLGICSFDEGVVTTNYSVFQMGP